MTDVLSDRIPRACAEIFFAAPLVTLSMPACEQTLVGPASSAMPLKANVKSRHWGLPR